MSTDRPLRDFGRHGGRGRGAPVMICGATYVIGFTGIIYEKNAMLRALAGARKRRRAVIGRG